EKKVFYFEYSLSTQKLTELVGFKKPKRKPMWANISPDTNKIVFGRNYNLFMMDKSNYEKALVNEDDSTIVETQLTFDGADNFSYHTQGTTNGSVENNEEKIKNRNKRKPVNILWSPNSAFFTMVRTDQRAVKDLWVINNVAQPRPTIETYKYWMPGEKEAPVEHLLLFTVADKKMKTLPAFLFKDQTLSIWPAPQKVASRDDMLRFSQWLGNNDGFYFARTSRDLKKIDICYADIQQGTVKPIIEERFNTYIELRRLVLVNDGKELIHWSERDGWGHFYLYGSDGTLKNQITTGAFHCEDVIGVDEKKRVLYFEANGREAGEDPYYVHSYKVNLDGSGLQLLNPGNFDHNSNFNDAKTFWVNNFSRVNTVPQSVLMNSDGKKLADLETADLSALFAAGYQFPQPFKVKADDGITDLFGVMYKPFDFDSTKKYPIIEYVYPGPQTEQVNKAFSRGMDRVDRLAQLGTIVISIGNRGGHPSRSKWYHNYGYGNLRNYGLADKKAAIEQL
ncbi:MAG: DPP IV N-terminal domain-containing protein, partial [Chitinophagaceae bacterium]